MKRHHLIQFTSFISIASVGFLSMRGFHSQPTGTDYSSLRGNFASLKATVSKYQDFDENILHEDTNFNNEVQHDLDIILEKAKYFISEASASELEDSTAILHEAILGMKAKIKKTTPEVLKNYNNISDSDKKSIEDEVYKQLENDVTSRFQEEVDLYLRLNEDTLDAIFKSEVNDGKSNEEMERGVKYESAFLVESLNNHIDMEEIKLEQTIRDRVQNIEKNVIFDNLGVEVTNKQLEKAEIDTTISDIEEELMKSAAESETLMYQEVSALKDSYKEIVNKILEDFLMKKKISSEQLEEIKEVIHSKIDDEFDYLFGDETLMLEDIIEDKLVEFEDASYEDRNIIDRATNLGMVTSAGIASSSNNVDIIEKDLDNKKNVLESAIKDSINVMERNIVEALSSTIADTGKRAFKEKGVDLTEEELSDLMHIETKSMNKLIEV